MAKNTGESKSASDPAKGAAETDQQLQQSQQESATTTGSNAVPAGNEQNGSGDQAAPAVDVDAMRKQLREELLAELVPVLREELSAQLRATPAMAAQAGNEQLVNELRAKEHMSKVDKILDEHAARVAAIEGALLEGPLKFSVSLKHNPTRTVGGSSQGDAERKYREYFGITGTEHPFEVTPL